MFGGKSQVRLILASKSPRRAEILHRAGITFGVQAAHVNEAQRPRESAHTYVRRLAAAKAHVAVERAKHKKGHAIVIGADTAIGLAFVVQIGLGALSRVVPRFGSFTLAFPLAFAAALIVTAIAVPLVAAHAPRPLLSVPEAVK